MSTKDSTKGAQSRRKFLAGAGAAAAGAATLGFPMIAKGQTGPIVFRWQSTWANKDIFHEYALDYAKKVNDMTGGDLKIDVLPAGAVVKAFELLDAVHKGTLDPVAVQHRHEHEARHEDAEHEAAEDRPQGRHGGRRHETRAGGHDGEGARPQFGKSGVRV